MPETELGGWLILTRRDGETIHLGDDIVIQVVATGRQRVQLAIRAPLGLKILRGELMERQEAGS